MTRTAWGFTGKRGGTRHPGSGFAPPAKLPQAADSWFLAAQGQLIGKLADQPNTRHAQNFILFVGDGMSVASVTAAQRKGDAPSIGWKLHHEPAPLILAMLRHHRMTSLAIPIVGGAACYWQPCRRHWCIGGRCWMACASRQRIAEGFRRCYVLASPPAPAGSSERGAVW